ncbi:MAG: DNA-binding transcriptional regulator [Planctomycetota bacterium]
MSPRQKAPKSVALLIESSNAYARGLLRGIVSYMRDHEPWSVYLSEQERGATPPPWLKNWHGDGLIVRIENDAIAKSIRRLELPTVDLSAGRHIPNIPWVETNDREIARLASEHLMQRGFQNLAYCGDPSFNWSRWRQEEFARLAKEQGRQCVVFESESPHASGFSIARERRRLTNWVLSLPKPVGIFACYDIKAQQMLDVCREAAVKVPEEVAVLGVDNDELLCDLCTPPLSSVMPSAQRAGREAARLLDALMRGDSVPEEHLIDPIGVVTRQSTDVLAIDDEDVATAVRFIRDHACDGINVLDVLRTVPVSRRVLETRFHEFIGRTPHQEIVRRRIDRACNLLANSDISLSRVANLTGFRSEGYLIVAFRREMGITPGQYRRSL